MQVCPELEMAVASLARFIPAEHQREAAKRIIEVFEQWLQQEKDAQGVKLRPANYAGPPSPRSMSIGCRIHRGGGRQARVGAVGTRVAVTSLPRRSSGNGAFSRRRPPPFAKLGSGLSAHPIGLGQHVGRSGCSGL